MDSKRLRHLADVIEGLTPDRFAMYFYAAERTAEEFEDFDEIDFLKPGELGNRCDTAGCIAGWAMSEFSDEPVRTTAQNGADLLDLSYWEGVQLFCSDGYTTTFWTQYGIPMSSALDDAPFTTEMVARALRELADGSVQLVA